MNADRVIDLTDGACEMRAMLAALRREELASEMLGRPLRPGWAQEVRDCERALRGIGPANRRPAA